MSDGRGRDRGVDRRSHGDYMKSKCTYLIAVRDSRQSLITGEKRGRERINLEINSNTC